MREEFKTALIMLLTAKTLKQPKTKAEIEDKIENALLSDKDKAILKRRLINRLTFDELAEKFDYSVQGVKKKFYTARKRL